MVEFLTDNWQILTAVFTALVYMYGQVQATRKGMKMMCTANRTN